MKKLLSFCLIVLILFALTACSDSAYAADEIREHSFQLAHLQPASMENPYHVFATGFAKYVDEYSGGKMKIEIIPNGQLGGSERDMLDGLQLSTLEMALLSGTGPTHLAPKFLTTDLPFIFANQQMAWDILLDGPLGREMLDDLEAVNIKGLGWGEGGFRHLINSKKKVSNLDDIAGLKIRTQESDVQIKTYQTLKVSPTPIAWAETFTAVQQGTVDGLDAPLSVLHSNKFQTVAPYISLTGHFYSPLFISASMSVWNSLNAAEQDILLKACIQGGKDQRQFNVELERRHIEEIAATGGQVNKEIDFASFQTALQPLYTEYESAIGKEYLDRILEATKNWKP